MFGFESAGNVTIIIRAYSSMQLLEKQYVENEVVSIITNAHFDVNFTNNNKNIVQGAKNILGFASLSPSSISIKAKTLTDSMYNFLATQRELDKIIYIPRSDVITTDDNGSVYLNRVPLESKFFQIKDAAKNTVDAFDIDYTTGELTNLAALTTYTCFYYYQDISLATYNITKLETPYFSIEILGDLNVNGVSRHLLGYIPRVSLDITPLLGFNERELTNTPLTFNIINEKFEISYY